MDANDYLAKGTEDSIVAEAPITEIAKLIAEIQSVLEKPSPLTVEDSNLFNANMGSSEFTSQDVVAAPLVTSIYQSGLTLQFNTGSNEIKNNFMTNPKFNKW